MIITVISIIKSKITMICNSDQLILKVQLIMGRVKVNAKAAGQQQYTSNCTAVNKICN